MSEAKGGGINVIPTQDAHFFAACVTCGVELESGTPGISNVYSKGRKYDPDEPGVISYHLDKKARDPLALAKVWRSPAQDMAEAEAMPGRMIKARTDDQWLTIADELEVLQVNCAVAHMRAFVKKEIGVVTRSVSDEEARAAKALSDLPEQIRNARTPRNGGRFAAKLSEVWNPAMVAWVKAWIANYTELRDAWQAANPAIKIEREGFPLVIQKGPNFEKLMRRWAR